MGVRLPLPGVRGHLSVVGQQVGTAVIINGGAPTLDGLSIDLVGDWSKASVATGHEALTIDVGSRAIIRNSTIEGFVSVGPDAAPTIADNQMPDTCLALWEPGSHPLVQRNTFRGCPFGWSIDFRSGASATLEGNDIANASSAITIAGDGTDIVIRDNAVHDSSSGILINGPAAPTIEHNQLTGNGVGISIVGASPMVRGNVIRESSGVGVLVSDLASPTLESNTIESNKTGILFSGGHPILIGNTVCGNETNLKLARGSMPDLTGNTVCPDAASPPPASP